jgi:hypothetical protein
VPRLEPIVAAEGESETQSAEQDSGCNHWAIEPEISAMPKR